MIYTHLLIVLVMSKPVNVRARFRGRNLFKCSTLNLLLVLDMSQPVYLIARSGGGNLFKLFTHLLLVLDMSQPMYLIAKSGGRNWFKYSKICCSSSLRICSCLLFSFFCRESLRKCRSSCQMLSVVCLFIVLRIWPGYSKCG